MQGMASIRTLHDADVAIDVVSVKAQKNSASCKQDLFALW